MNHENKSKLFELADLLKWFEDNGHRIWYDENTEGLQVRIDGHSFFTGEEEYTILPGKVLGELER